MVDTDCDHFFKILLLGDSGVGKSSLITRFVDDQFLEAHNYSIGLDFKIKTVDVEGKRVRLQVWDTAGQERFRTITSSYYRGSRGIVVVFGMDDQPSFEHIKDWLEEIFRYLSHEEVKVFIVGNKADLTNRKVDARIAKNFAESYKLSFYETSAKTSENVDKIFLDITKEILARRDIGGRPSVLLERSQSVDVRYRPPSGEEDRRCGGGSCSL